MHGAHPGDRVAEGPRQPVDHLRSAAHPRHAEQQLTGIRREPRGLELALDAHEVTGDELGQDPLAPLRIDAELLQERGVGRRVTEADSVGLQPGGIEGAAEHGQRLGRPLRRRCADELDPRLQELPRLTALWTHATVGVGEVAEAQRRLGRR